MKRFLVVLSLVALSLTTSCSKNWGTEGNYSAYRYKGNITSTHTDGSTFKIDPYFVEIVIPNSFVKKLNLVFENLRFAEGDTAFTAQLEDIEFKETISEDETINHIFEATEIVPSIGGKASPENTITNLAGCISKESVDITFTVASRNVSVKFTTKKSPIAPPIK